MNTPIEDIYDTLRKNGRNVQLKFEWDPNNGIHPRQTIYEELGSFFKRLRLAVVREESGYPDEINFINHDPLIRDAIAQAERKHKGLKARLWGDLDDLEE